MKFDSYKTQRVTEKSREISLRDPSFHLRLSVIDIALQIEAT